jgi:diguanylate cyclase (GGDEF)-like protein
MVKRHGSGGNRLSLSLIDIDHFKSFNDTYGHAAGDHVLTVVASVLAANLRPTDLVARFGGEEFVIIFPDTSVEEAAVAAERVRAAVARESLVTPEGTKLPSVTISMGVSELTTGQSVPNLLKSADRAMYEAKQAGRNRVVVG